jgi:hypothetical protein
MEAKEEVPFALYSPALLPQYVDTTPQVFRVQHESSLPPDIYIYYVSEGQNAEHVLLIIASSAGASSRTHYAADERQLIPLEDGSFVIDRSAVIAKVWREEFDIVKGPPYQTGLWWDLDKDGDKAWYNIYSTLSLTKTVEIVDSMQPVP